MKANGSDVATKSVANPQKQGTLADWMNDRKNAFMSAIPKGTIEIDRFVQSAVMAITNPKNPQLRNCTKDSIFRALKESASYGLEVSGVLGQAYLIPYNENVQIAPGKWEKQMTCHFQMGYKGLIALARRSNTIKTIAAEPIHENDILDIELGMNRHLSHKIDIFKERGDIVGYYCLVELTNGGCQFHVMTKKDVEAHRNKFSKAYNPNDKENIWNKNFDAMALKTCVIQALKLCPISVEALTAISNEEKEMDSITLDESEYTVSDVVDESPKIEKESPKEIAAPSVPQNQPEMTFNKDMQFTQEENNLANQAFDSMNQSFDGDVF